MADQLLLHAIAHGDRDNVEALLETHASVNSSTSIGSTPLHASRSWTN